MNEDNDLPNLVWISHNPMGPGGFQTVTRNLLKRLTGWNINVIAIETGTSMLPYDYDGYGIYECSTGCGLRHYIAELMPDVVVVYGAYWHMQQYMNAITTRDFQQVMYIVIEGPPIPSKWHEDLSKFDMIMTPSIASAQDIVDIGYDAYIVHHGVDHAIYYPNPKIESQFLYGSVKVNNFKAQIGRLLSSYNDICRDQHSKLLLHTNPIDSRGVPLKDFVKTYDMEDYVKFSQYGTCAIGMMPTKMAQLYNSLNTYVSCSGGDTVNLPALEAAACGIPSILSDVPGPAEYVGDSATYIPTVDSYPSGFGRIRLVDQKKLSEVMMEYYKNESLREHKSKIAIEYSKQWPWERAVDELQKNLSGLL